MLSVRSTAFAPAASSDAAGAEVVAVEETELPSASLSKHVGAELSKSERPELGAARVVVSAALTTHKHILDEPPPPLCVHKTLCLQCSPLVWCDSCFRFSLVLTRFRAAAG